MNAAADLDPRWEWIELHAFGDPTPHYVKSACRHLETVPVDLLTGKSVAQLCLTCDGQLPLLRAASPESAAS